MARPLYCIKEKALISLYEKYSMGIPISKLIKNYNIQVSHPTFTKLLMQYSLLVETKGSDIYDTIYASYFPEWLNYEEYEHDIIVLQPSNWNYIGTYPLGEWVENTKLKGE